MPANHLEQFIAEWLEYSGYFVRRNVKVGKRQTGGHEGELDIVAFHPGRGKLVHYEASTDTHNWAKREQRFAKKFAAGKKHIRSLFSGLPLPERLEQYAVFLHGSQNVHTSVAGGQVVMMDSILREVFEELKGKALNREIVPEQFPLLRTFHLACAYRRKLFAG